MVLSKEAQDNELNSTGTCPVTGLPVTSRPEWTDVSFGNDYRITVNIIGNNDGFVKNSNSRRVPLKRDNHEAYFSDVE